MIRNNETDFHLYHPLKSAFKVHSTHFNKHPLWIAEILESYSVLRAGCGYELL